jgi:hypothetical protein
MIDDTPTNEEIKIKDTISSHKAIPFFYTEDDYQIGIDGWAEFLQPCTELKTKDNTYYYALIEGKSIYTIDASRIKSFTAMQSE